MPMVHPYDIAEKSTKTQEVLSAMGLAVDIYGKLMDLSTNGAILEKTVKWLEDRRKILPTPEEQKQIDKILGETSTITATEDDSDISIESGHEEDLSKPEQ
jgi:hypothetical protein